MQNIREEPVWRGVPDPIKAGLKEAPPDKPQDSNAVYEQFRSTIVPYTFASIHPRAWGWVIGVGTPQGIVHEMLTAALNSNVFGAEESPSYVEAQVIDWFKTKLGYPAEASGILVSGGSTANLIGLAVARTAMEGKETFRRGMQGIDRSISIYCSHEAHNSIAKAIALLGIGTDSLRSIPVDQDFRMSIPELLRQIERDRQNGIRPLCIVGTAGTTNTAAVDDLDQISEIASRERIWFHVDGAIGAVLKFSPTLSPIVAGLEKADSVAFDLHKWLHIPQGAGCILTRHPQAHRETFSSKANYLTKHPRGIGSGSIPFSEYGIETSRPFRALKIWFALKEHGFSTYVRMIEKNVALARTLAERIRRHSHRNR